MSEGRGKKNPLECNCNEWARLATRILFPFPLSSAPIYGREVKKHIGLEPKHCSNANVQQTRTERKEMESIKWIECTVFFFFFLLTNQHDTFIFVQKSLIYASFRAGQLSTLLFSFFFVCTCIATIRKLKRTVRFVCCPCVEIVWFKAFICGTPAKNLRTSKSKHNCLS